jgi:hypothetical protein
MTTGADWVDQARRLLDAFVAGSAAEPADQPAGGGRAHGSDCSWCPLCQAAAVVRGERPEVTAALADVLTTTATALRTFAESVPPAEPDPPASEDDAPEAEPPPAVQRIEIA